MKSVVSRARSKSKRVVTRGVRFLSRSSTFKKIARKNPKIVTIAKKLSRRIFGVNTKDDPKEGRQGSRFNELINPDLSTNYADHDNLLHNNRVYWHERESAGIYERHESDPRIVAIYLPQFHPFKENDEAWGKGFTEWTNVTAATPKFVGQQQPVLPADLGFCDLRLPATIKQQIDLAKKYGIYGFQFYYYWFSGKKVMDLPINTVLDNSDWDFHFSICWANENWTRKWDGGDNDIIFEQKNNPEDPLRFIEEVSPILNDPRYILENSKPILTVYRVELLDDPEMYVKVWRKYFKDTFNKELWLVGHTYTKSVNPTALGFDATMDFTPVSSLQPELKPWVDDRKYLTNAFRENRKLLDLRWIGEIIDFRFIAKQEINNLSNNSTFYKTISPSWSNEARRKGSGGYTFWNSSPELFVHWLDKILDYETNILNKKAPIVFINAWNEWAESAMLEPSQHMGHNSLLRIAETISNYSKNKNNKKAFPYYRFSYSPKSELAVVVHLFYPEMWDTFRKELSKINVEFDMYVSIPSQHSDIDLGKISKFHNKTNIIPVPNRGRDVLPFITIMNRVRKLNKYKYVLKVHTKKSKHRDDGDKWLSDVLRQLIPDDTSSVIRTLSHSSTGIIGPKGHLVSLARHMSGNRQNIINLLKLMTDKSYKDIVVDETKSPFIGSTMFWCRVDFLDPLLDAFLMPSDFPREEGQIDNTTAHAIERVLGKILHGIGKRKMYVVDQDGKVSRVPENFELTDKYQYAE